ncbi:riboflavin biosynthesis protein RibF [Colidextribacter sp. OB.20]|uniref:riboflavin biosynthesis protein RibF n=1 Tax=Colidextribacter sp. OB.20 TaxID=2304568 RepID=UPI00136B015C|nr:riboflavin biosynthesis protein RibF [Colidextribacter sp. OB.20]NBI10979.1 riboflavin biosynthesis protein RibF [Colidextribacter sp. OB.20]
MTKPKRVIALGFFDGVHLGHGALLRRVKETADRLGAVPTAFTFDKSPAAALTGRDIPLLSTLEDRTALMDQLYGIQEMVIAPFTTMQHMDWEEFVGDYLVQKLGVVHVVAGHDFRFGYMGRGNPERLKEKCAQLGVGCDIIPKVELDGVTISSTYIRSLIANGELERAVEFLGHPLQLTAPVRHGKHLGSSLGFPTVNLSLPEGVIVPALGVYAAKVWVLPDGREPPGPRHLPGDGPYLSVTNVGVRPTVADGDRVTVEGFILDFRGDLYGRSVRMEFYKYLRPERKFPSVEALAEEVKRNAEETRAYFEGA